jgi:hypothetical protein
VRTDESNAIQFLYSPERSVDAGLPLPAFGAAGLAEIEFEPQFGCAGENHPASTDQEISPKTGRH